MLDRCKFLLISAMAFAAIGPSLAMNKYDHNVNIIEELRIRDGLPNVFKRLEKNKPVTVVYLGGSITHAEGWRPKTFQWLETQFPKAKLTQVDAAVPGTGADFAAARYATDVRPYKPDLIYIEYRVNMGGGVEARAIDGLIQQIWKDNPKTDICLVYTIAKWMLKGMEDGGQQYHFGKIMEGTANYYGIPSIDLAPEVLKQKAAGTLIFQSPKPIEGKLVFSKDGVHPVDAGYEVYKDIVARSLTAMDGEGKPGPHVLLAPLESQHTRDAAFIPISAATTYGNWEAVDTAADAVYSNDSFRTGKMLSDAIKTNEEGASYTIKWTGTRLTLTTIPQVNGWEILHTTDGSAPKPLKFKPKKNTGMIFAEFSNLPEQSQGEHTTTVTVKKFPKGKSFYAGQFVLLQDPK